MSLIYAYKNRGITKDIQILNGAGNVIVPGIADVIRIVIGYEGSLDTDPILIVTSQSPTSNGSSFSKNTPASGTNRLRLDANDLNFEAGVYTLSVELLDNADAVDLKEVSRQVLVLADT